MLLHFFPVSSEANTAISFGQVHATFWPFRHRMIKKWISRLIIPMSSRTVATQCMVL